MRAKDPLLELNGAKDTLILNCVKTIDYVYAINSIYKREIDFYNNTASLKIPLNQLSSGKHVFVVGHSRMQIVFVVHVSKDKATVTLVSKNKITASEN